MNKIKNKVIMMLLIILPLSINAQQNFTVGGSGGLLSFDKQSDWNANLFAGYQINESITVGVDFMQSKLNSNLQLTSYTIYGEAGNNKWGFIKRDEDKNLIYFSWLLGLGMMQQKVGDLDESDFTFNAGVKLNVDFGSNFLFGYKGNLYGFNKESVVQNNVFFAYKF